MTHRMSDLLRGSTGTSHCIAALSAVAVCIGLAVPHMGHAQDRPARLVVGFAPGGVADAVARTVADRLRGSYAAAVVVENRPGGSGRVAVDVVKAADPDGLTMLVTPNPMITIYPHAYGRLSYDPERDLAAVTMLGTYPLVLAVGPAVPATVRSPRELVDWLKADPKRASYGTSAAGSTLHFIGIAFGMQAGVPMTHVAYKGGGPAVQDLVGGQIPMVVVTPAAVRPQLGFGRVRALAVTGERRTALFPDVPTFAEAGYAGLAMQDWIGVFVPARTPADRVARLAAALEEAVQSAPVRETFAKVLVEPRTMAPAAFAEAVRAETRLWSPLVKASGFVGDE